MADAPSPVGYLPFYSRETDIYALPELVEHPVDAAYLRELGVSVTPSAETLAGLERGSRIFAQRFRERTLLPHTRFRTGSIDPAREEPEI
ncbi:MAG: hypothetical protein II791_05135, partial [Bacteroidales bacterium]|nr:hypothetical protein [Bacteroidales bacterium]